MPLIILKGLDMATKKKKQKPTKAEKLERRVLTRTLQNARRRAERHAAQLRKQAASYKRVKTEAGGYRLAAQAKELLREAREIEKIAKRSTARTPSGKRKTNARIIEMIEGLNEARVQTATASFSNNRFMAAMREARKGLTTPEFGEGSVAKMKVNQFWRWSQPIWGDKYKVSERGPALLHHFKVKTMAEVWNIFEKQMLDGVGDGDGKGQSFYVWLNDRMNLGFDTDDPNFNRLVMEAFESLGSPEPKKSLANEFYAATGQWVM